MMWRWRKIADKREPASQPGFWFKTTETLIQEWWINDKWNIVCWVRESSDSGTAFEAREIRVKFKINFLQRKRGSNFEGKKSVATRTGIFAGQCSDCSALLCSALCNICCGQKIQDKTKQKQIQARLIRPRVTSLCWGLLVDNCSWWWEGCVERWLTRWHFSAGQYSPL